MCKWDRGRKAHAWAGPTMLSNSTRNVDDLIGDGPRSCLGSTEPGAVISTMSKIPTPAQYLAVVKERVVSKTDGIYQVPAVRQEGRGQEDGLIMEWLEAEMLGGLNENPRPDLFGRGFFISLNDTGKMKQLMTAGHGFRVKAVCFQ